VTGAKVRFEQQLKKKKRYNKQTCAKLPQLLSPTRINLPFAADSTYSVLSWHVLDVKRRGNVLRRARLQV